MPQKWMEVYEQKRYESHKKRLREAKSTIDKTKPAPMPMSMKRELERKREQQAIEQDNRLLLDRLADAMNRKNIDNVLHPQHIISYNSTKRSRDLKRIYEENQVILHRIQTTLPYYRSINWEKDNEQRIEYLKNMTEFPHLFVPPGSKKKGSNSITSPLNTSSFKTTVNESQFLNTSNDNLIEIHDTPSPPEIIPLNFNKSNDDINYNNNNKSYNRVGNRVIQSNISNNSLQTNTNTLSKLPSINMQR